MYIDTIYLTNLPFFIFQICLFSCIFEQNFKPIYKKIGVDSVFKAHIEISISLLISPTVKINRLLRVRTRLLEC